MIFRTLALSRTSLTLVNKTPPYYTHIYLPFNAELTQAILDTVSKLRAYPVYEKRLETQNYQILSMPQLPKQTPPSELFTTSLATFSNPVQFWQHLEDQIAYETMSMETLFLTNGHLPPQIQSNPTSKPSVFESSTTLSLSHTSKSMLVKDGSLRNFLK